MAASLVEPGYAGAIPPFERRDTGPHFLDDPNTFVTKDHTGLVSEVAVLYVKVSVTHAAALHSQQRFAMPQRP
jgi:hypothetical protein